MIGQWLAFFAALGMLAVLVVGAALVAGEIASPRIDTLFVALFIIGVLGVLVGGISGAAISIGRHYGRVSCRSFAAQTNRPTKFAIYNAWSKGECLTRTTGGKWIPTKNLREFGNTP